MRHFLRLFSILCLLSSASATEVMDLGAGLGYLRAHSLDEAIKPLAGGNAIVLDLRHATATPEAVAQFTTALAGRTADSRLYVLVSPATPAPVADVLKGNLVTLGVKDSQPAPQVVVAQTAEADRAAYDALEAGTPLAQLISGKIEKERFDEASLVHEFKNGNHDAKPPEADPAKAAGSPAALTDRVLQRAVHLHRTLLALRR